MLCIFVSLFCIHWFVFWFIGVDVRWIGSYCVMLVGTWRVLEVRRGWWFGACGLGFVLDCGCC